MYFRKYIENQKKMMEDYKWGQGEKLKRDPGEAACREWIEKYADQYRKEYNKEFELLIENVLLHTDAKIKELQKNSNIELPPQVIQEIAKIFLTQFTNEWTVEKVLKPKNSHVDEI